MFNQHLQTRGLLVHGDEKEVPVLVKRSNRDWSNDVLKSNRDQSNAVFSD